MGSRYGERKYSEGRYSRWPDHWRARVCATEAWTTQVCKPPLWTEVPPPGWEPPFEPLPPYVEHHRRTR